MLLKKYIYSQISLSFFPIFLSLFFITSLIFLVRISSLTSVITVSLYELFVLYTYMIPNIIFYTLPISFFIGLVASIGRLSSELELTVITSFGLNPLKILKIFAPITFFITVFLLIVSIGLMPKSKMLTNEMIEIKKIEANFNIKASEFGQKFGDWVIYIEEKEDKEYRNIKLFKLDSEKNSEQFITANKANIINDGGSLKLVLTNGKAFYIQEKEFNQINFEQMTINDTLSQNKIEIFDNVVSYWKDKFERNDDKDKFAFYILSSFFPFISLLLVISFGYFNPRFEKNKSVVLAIGSIVIFYLVSNSLSRSLEFYSLILIPLLWIATTYVLYSKRVKPIY